ncbi:MAG: 16S rRNA (adenine(1518)-N(6)/adenine(1519)-N(6))-dimethyltransferase RsmA [Bacteroidales bacterium]
MSKRVRPKKYLGQHFLTDIPTAHRIADGLGAQDGGLVLEVGPGMGVLTGRLLERFGERLWVVEIDTESVEYLTEKFPTLIPRILSEDFLKLDLAKFTEGPISVIGNFPYNISSQILFHLLDYREKVMEITGMFQREVAQRLTAGPGGKEYGILSVLMGAFYHSEYLYSVPPDVFMPPPKVTSAVIRFVRKADISLPASPVTFKMVVKMAFNQRRKTLRNALSAIWSDDLESTGYGSLRAEQLSVEQFLELAVKEDQRKVSGQS